MGDEQSESDERSELLKGHLVVKHALLTPPLSQTPPFRYGITDTEEVNPNVRYQLEGGADMSKEDAIESLATKVAAKVNDRCTDRKNKFHLVCGLTKGDLDSLRVSVESKGVAPRDIIVNTADTRSKGGRKHTLQVAKWKKAISDAPLVMFSTQVSEQQRSEQQRSDKLWRLASYAVPALSWGVVSQIVSQIARYLLNPPTPPSPSLLGAPTLPGCSGWTCLGAITV